MSETRATISRRTMVRGTAVAGGVLWAAPAITSYGSRAFGTTGTPKPGQDISFVAMLLERDGKRYRTKFEAEGAQECGPKFAVDGCSDQLSRYSPDIEKGCPAGVTATLDPVSGSLTVALGLFTLVDYVVKCGVPSDPEDQGCIDPDDPNAGNQPSTGSMGLAIFNPCQAPA